MFGFVYSCFYSTGKRASSSLLQIILDFLQRIPGGMERIVKQNQEELYIGAANTGVKSGKRASFSNVAKDERISKLFSYPSSVTGTHSIHLKFKYENIYKHMHIS